MFKFLLPKSKSLAQARQDALNSAYARKFELELERDSIDGALEGLQMRIDRLEHEQQSEAKVAEKDPKITLAQAIG